VLKVNFMLSVMLGRHAAGLFLIVLFGSSPAFASTSLTFCYQDTELTPYYLGEGNLVPTERPGATIEHLQLIAAKVPGLTVKLVRYPWLRCLKNLQNGIVDAVVANYSDERRKFGVFPLLQNKPDPNREFIKQEICFVARKELAKKWNGNSFDDISKVVVAHQAGRNLEQMFRHRQFVKIPISAQAKALHMLAQNKVQAVTMVCTIAGKSALAKGFDPALMQVLTPQMEVLHGHLMFSQQFYQAHQVTAEALWDQLSEQPLAIYMKYLNDDSME